MGTEITHVDCTRWWIPWRLCGGSYTNPRHWSKFCITQHLKTQEEDPTRRQRYHDRLINLLPVFDVITGEHRSEYYKWLGTNQPYISIGVVISVWCFLKCRGCGVVSLLKLMATHCTNIMLDTVRFQRYFWYMYTDFGNSDLFQCGLNYKHSYRGLSSNRWTSDLCVWINICHKCLEKRFSNFGARSRIGTFLSCP
jgi:hypothetical protein